MTQLTREDVVAFRARIAEMRSLTSTTREQVLDLMAQMLALLVRHGYWGDVLVLASIIAYARFERQAADLEAQLRVDEDLLYEILMRGLP